MFNESETMAAEMQLRAEVIRKRFQKENGAGQQPTLTTTTVGLSSYLLFILSRILSYIYFLVKAKRWQQKCN
jgi:hypothetical protein